MNEKPILFSGAMVRAVLSGQKTMTRRVMLSQPPEHWQLWSSECEPSDGLFTWDFCGNGKPWNGSDCNVVTRCPYGAKGSMLWVRETCMISPVDFYCGSDYTHSDFENNRRIVQYLASHPDKSAAQDYGIKVTPSIFMPRWASRITLRITSIHVERIQDITEQDAIAEGIHQTDSMIDRFYCMAENQGGVYRKAVPAFRELWDSINSKRGYGWHKNPWVWEIGFERVPQ